MSTLKVNRIEPRTGDTVEIVGLDIPEPTESPVKAWVNFNGTGTVAIRDSMNVSSITDHAIGNYSVNFATPMPDANYCGVFSVSFDSNRGGHKIITLNENKYRIQSVGENENYVADSQFACVSIIR